MSAACGNATQHVGFIATTVLVPSLRRLTNPTSASLRTWWETVGCPIPNASARAPDCDSAGSARDAVQQPHPHRFGQAREPLCVRCRRQLARARSSRPHLGPNRRRAPSGSAAMSCTHYIDLRRWLHSSTDVDTVRIKDRLLSMKGKCDDRTPRCRDRSRPIGLAAAAQLRERGSHAAGVRARRRRRRRDRRMESRPSLLPLVRAGRPGCPPPPRAERVERPRRRCVPDRTAVAAALPRTPRRRPR